MEPSVGIMQKLLEIQQSLKVEKGRWNDFGGYYSRSKEDILEAAKPLAHERGCVVVCDDDILPLAEGWVYAKTTARLTDAYTGETVSAVGFAREPESKPKMDSSQTTGSACSYSGKRALGNLFALDDTADSDQLGGSAPGPFVAACTVCGTQYRFDSEQQMNSCACQCGNRTFARV